MLVLLGASSAFAAPPQSEIAIKCGRLIDARSDSAVANAVIEVQDGKIVAVGANLAVPAQAQVIDLSHATCLPGLIDLHAHILVNPEMGAGDSGFINRSSARKALDGLHNSQIFLNHGFTTLRDPGDEDAFFSTVDIRNAIASGEFVGPRLLVAPHWLTATGGHGDLNDIAPDLLSLAEGKIVSGPDSMREAVRQEIKYGADWIKLYVTGGVMSAADNPRVTSFTDEEVRAAVEETHRHGKKITVHAIGTGGIKQSLQAGVDSIEHGILIDPEGIAMMKERGITLVPTLYVLNYVVEQGPRMGIPPESIAKGRSLIDERDRNIRAAFAAGVKIGFGSDTIYPVEQASREFALLVGLGLTPLQAIRAATINAAELLGLEKEIGTIEAGKTADIVAVGENPTENVRTLENVKFVMKSGAVIKNEF